MSLVGWVLVLAVVIWLLSRRRKKAKAAAVAERSKVEAFVAEVVARGVAARSSVGVDQLTAALAGTPEPDVVGQVEELVREVEVGFERLPDGVFEVRAHVRFEDASVHDAARRFDLADLPEAVQVELRRSGSARSFRRWEFPWARSGGAWVD